MNENLNDIFANVQTDTPMGETALDDGLTIDVCNSAGGASHKYKVYPENSLREVLDICKNDLGLASSGEQVVFEFNGKTCSDPRLTVKDFGIVDGGKLLINPNGKVA